MKSGNIYADLHVHSTASDGLYSSSQLVKLADEAGIEVMAITDHDTLAGIEDALNAAESGRVKVIPGIELSCGWPDREASFHVLGLFVDPLEKDLNQLLDRQRDFRFHRAMKILDLLEHLKVDVEPLRKRFRSDPKRVLGRPHVARYLAEIGVVKDSQQAFSEFLSRGKSAYVPKNHVPPEEAVDAIRRSGGLSVIAHPGLIPDWNDIWPRIIQLDWDGMEVYYPEHSSDQQAFFAAITVERGWVATGGSDYHGECGKHAKRFGRYGMTCEQYEKVAARAAAKSSSLG